MNEAFNRDLVEPEQLRAAIDGLAHQRGAWRVRRLLDRDSFAVTATVLEQRLLPIARAAGLPLPQTQARREGGRVDFYFAELGLIVEADSLRFHRTPSQQRSDRLRDQKHLAAGLTTLRFTHHQICHEPDHVAAILAAVASRLAT